MRNGIGIVNPYIALGFFQVRAIFGKNKNALTGPANFKKQLDIMPSCYDVQNQGKLIMQSRENGQKPQFGQFLDDFEAKCLKIAIFSVK